MHTSGTNCDGPHCCNGLSLQRAEDRMVPVMLDVCLGSMPLVPRAGTWAEISSCLDFVVLSYTHGMLRYLWAIAFQQVQVPVVGAAADAPEHQIQHDLCLEQVFTTRGHVSKNESVYDHRLFCIKL